MRVASATLSEDGKYRYDLRRGRVGASLMHWVMLNPSTADATNDDATIRRCKGFAELYGFGGITVHNLFAVRATEPRVMMTLDDPVGEHNHRCILKMRDYAVVKREPIVCAWGNHGSYMDQANTMLGWLDLGGGYDSLILCLGKTSSGQPRHPVRLGYNEPLIRMDGKPQRRFMRNVPTNINTGDQY